jgi:hypothetical protein
VRRALIVLGSMFAVGAFLAVGWMLLPNSLFYRGGRPTPLGRRVNRAIAALYASGLIPHMSALEVRRRWSGGMQRQPVVIGEHGGQEYLVSMLGERAEWVKNVRAADGAAVLRHWSARPVRLREVAVDQRAPVIKAYIGRAFGARPHVPVRPEAPLSEFERIAAAYPVFRIVDDA